MDASKPGFARPFLRSRGAIVLAATAATAVAAVAFKYKSDALRNNELAQRTQKAPNGYVAVDRSGGGI